jgi:hypothetical protein
VIADDFSGVTLSGTGALPTQPLEIGPETGKQFDIGITDRVQSAEVREDIDDLVLFPERITLSRSRLLVTVKGNRRCGVSGTDAGDRICFGEI